MSTIYKNEKTNLQTVVGTVKSIDDTRTNMVVEAEKRTRDTNGKIVISTEEVKVASMTPIEEEIKVGYTTTVVGEMFRGALQADAILKPYDYYENKDLAWVQGLVLFASMNEEKNPDGSPRLKQDGTPKKPHFDVTVKVNDGEKFVNHIIRIYDGKDGGEIERAKKLFGKFNKDTNRIRVTFITSPGQEYSSPSKDGQYTNHYMSHLGYRKLDLEYLDQKEKAQDKNVAKPEKTEPVAPAHENGMEATNGIGQEMEPDMENMFS